jgi:LacI family transcriptional regulator
MPKAPTLADVARRAGVHPATASRALNPATRELLNEETVERVMAAARQIGYSPNSIARALRTSKTRTVGVLLPDLTNPIFPPMVRGIEDALAADAHTALLAETDNDDAKEREAVAALQDRQVDGLLFANARRDHPLIEEVHQGGQRIVLVNRVTDHGNIPAVVEDGESGILAAFSHLRGMGHRHIAHLAGPRASSTGFVRAKAFARAVATDGLEHETSVLLCDQFSIASGARTMDHLLERRPDITAVIAGNDLIALGALTSMAAKGLRCPEDVSVIGFNDMPFLEFMAPPLTTVNVSHYDLGFRAARMLLTRMADPQVSIETSVLPVRLIVRASTGPPRS